MLYVSEATVKDLVAQDEVTAAVSQAFVGLAQGTADCWPIVRETLNYADAIFGFKSGFDRENGLLGIKAGGLWPGNAARGIANHQSTIMLFDPDSGSPMALIRGTYLTGLRTAAASALSIRHLARLDAKTLGIIGAGGQGLFQVKAALNERAFSKVLVCDPNRSSAQKLSDQISQSAVASETVEQPDDLANRSEVIITITPSRAQLFSADAVRPGTHLAAMGADTRGKQEIDPGLISQALVFGDVAEQAITLGECQHAYAADLISADDIVTLGNVITGHHAGRTDDQQITLFDSTGMSMQDLVAANAALETAIKAGRAIELD